ncbi:PTS lactose transporter subunit IIC [Sphingomonas gilva]|uniref:PTS lactose transporter subunit IIC n=1 Tax=Sphingomonas gilva TaxID=2305907 RepID=A0A396RMY8_9SPHN|nr:PTS sugar transporter subunit IIA [Sphingomonas gilva]RHW17790.1 PTS lactose transporter subunit IIC [Sphingomonas gilva]
MTDLSDLLTPASVVTGEAVAGKKALFQQIAALAVARLGVDPVEVVERLGERERLGSTGFGGGIALPHAKMAGLSEVAAFFIQLPQGIEFQAIDHLPVDLVFALLSPPDAGADHLKALARVSRRMRERTFVAKLRGAGSADALYALLAGVEARDAA